MAAAQGACLNHVSRESSDVKRLAKFYKEVHLSLFFPIFNFFFGRRSEIIVKMVPVSFLDFVESWYLREK